MATRERYSVPYVHTGVPHRTDGMPHLAFTSLTHFNSQMQKMLILEKPLGVNEDKRGRSPRANSFCGLCLGYESKLVFNRVGQWDN